MDLLHFMKEEYSAIRSHFPGLAPGDLAESLEGSELQHFMARVELGIKVGGDLVIPELVEAGRAASAAAMLAEEQTRSLARVVVAYKRAGTLPDLKRAEIFRKIAAHVDQMERVVLPLVRELIPTAVREDIGEIAVDYREDLASLLGKPSKPEAGSTISA